MKKLKIDKVKEGLDLLNDLFDASNKIPANIKKLKQLIKASELEKEEVKLAKGGKEIGLRANPKRV